MSVSIQQRRATFRGLHEQGCFIMPNPWDVGTAIYLQRLGFPALGSTSAGFAWTLGVADGRVPRAAILEHLRNLVQATNLPVSADFESGFGADPDGVAHSVRLAVDTGIAGLSIEDSSGDVKTPIRDMDRAVARLQAARQAIDDSGKDVILVGRAENYLHGRPDLDDTITRLKAYAEAGADCLYAPGLSSREDITAVVKAVAPKPVNVLVGRTTEFTVQDLADMGVRRISIGGALSRTAWYGLEQAATPLVRDGSFEGLGAAMPHAALNSIFAKGKLP
ncbi:MAG TPA: isocitrate lyase/phosphoenolpyruvate mutase family protein [Burkholderiaceae bacterium]|nr:isocitrate lyase/phosphoenolpyruvate mutase family protein [Burkholderiaceae bacterium]